MSLAKNSLIAVLAVTTIVGAGFAWYEYKELMAVRAASVPESERADLQKQIADLQKKNRELEDSVAAARTTHSDAPPARGARDAEPTLGGEPPPGPSFGRGGGPRDPASRPEIQAMMNASQRGNIITQYAALFRNLNLTSDQSNKLASLLLDRQNALRDVFGAAREQGLDPRADREAIQKLVQDTQNSIDDGIKSLIGDNGFAQLSQYEQTVPQRTMVSMLQQRLTFTDSPLTSAQAEQLVQILAANSELQPSTPGRASDLRRIVRGMPGAGDNISPAAISQAASFLNQTQLSALQQMQQQQEANRQLQETMRNTWGGGPRGAGSGNVAPQAAIHPPAK